MTAIKMQMIQMRRGGGGNGDVEMNDAGKTGLFTLFFFVLFWFLCALECCVFVSAKKGKVWNVCFPAHIKTGVYGWGLIPLNLLCVFLHVE